MKEEHKNAAAERHAHECAALPGFCHLAVLDKELNLWADAWSCVNPVADFRVGPGKAERGEYPENRGRHNG